MVFVPHLKDSSLWKERLNACNGTFLVNDDTVCPSILLVVPPSNYRFRVLHLTIFAEG